LNPQQVVGARGPHYWKDGTIYWTERRQVRSSAELGVTSRIELELPDWFQGPARFISESILADKSNVYLNVGDRHYQRVLEDFLCWYVCGSQLGSGDFVIRAYGDHIYRVDAATREKTLLLTKPAEARHFHVTAVDPFTNDIYTTLGDALKKYKGYGVTGIMRSRDSGKTWNWLYKTTVGSGAIDRQPTAIFFDKDRIYFGTDSKPHGIFVLDRNTDRFEQGFFMSDLLASWFTAIVRKKGSLWALSRAFGKDDFGVLWWSGDGSQWTPIQIFAGLPIWLEADEEHDLMSVGFVIENENYSVIENAKIIAMNLPDYDSIAEKVRTGPTPSLLDSIFRERVPKPLKPLTLPEK
jgi:hypothetical protein